MNEKNHCFVEKSSFNKNYRLALPNRKLTTKRLSTEDRKIDSYFIASTPNSYHECHYDNTIWWCHHFTKMSILICHHLLHRPNFQGTTVAIVRSAIFTNFDVKSNFWVDQCRDTSYCCIESITRTRSRVCPHIRTN